ncbi:MAG: ATP-binding protein [Erysipelotrichaceae bacterium]
MLLKKSKNKENVKEKSTKKEIKNKKQKTIERNTLNAIPYINMFRNGICELDQSLFSTSLKFTDVNYQIASEEDRLSIFGRYAEILNSLSSSEGIELTIQNKVIDFEEFKAQTLYQYTHDGFDNYRQEFNDMLLNNIKVGNNAIVSERMITYTSKQDSYDEAFKSLNQVANEYATQFKHIGSKCEMMDGMERLQVLHNTFDPENKLMWNYDSKDTKTTKQAIAPSSIEIFKDHLEIGTSSGIRYAKVMYLKNYSTELSDKLISDIAKLEFNLTMSFHMKVLDNADAISLIKIQNAKMEYQKMNEQKRALKGGWDPEMIPQELRYSLEEADSLLKDVQQRNQRLFSCQFVIMPNCASIDELNDIEKRIKNVARKHSTEIADMQFLQEDGLGAVLPLGITKLPIVRTLTTGVCGTFIPFTSQELCHGSGSVFYGVNATTNNLILCNRTELLNPSGWTLGSPGGGKSFASKREIISVMLLSDKNDVIIIDPENEYGFIASLFKDQASIINISNKSNVYLNPLDGEMECEDDFIKTKADFLQAMCSAIVGEKGMTSRVCSIIDRCTRIMYSQYQDKLDDVKNVTVVKKPTFTDFYNILKEQKDQDSLDLTISLELYVEGSNNMFAQESNVNVNSRMTVYNILDLGKSLHPLAMLVILESLWERIMKNKKLGRTTWVYIDEIYLLFKSSYCTTFFKELWKRARKYNAVVTGITQNVEELLNNEEVRTMLSNSEFIMMLNQSSSDRDELMPLLNISEEQAQYISNSEEGSGLLFNGKVIVPVKDKFPKNTELYKAMTTKPSERNVIDNLSGKTN